MCTVYCVLCCVLASNARKRNIDFKQIHTLYAHTHTLTHSERESERKGERKRAKYIHPHTSNGIKAKQLVHVKLFVDLPFTQCTVECLSITLHRLLQFSKRVFISVYLREC